jgi:peptidoglycan/LPS O-acetylase OafA/YrhL
MKRIPQLDGLRAIAILMVFAAHAFNVPLFWMGVDLFFVLSGYLITGILLGLKDRRAVGGSYWGSFYGRRARRILPPYVAFLILLTIFRHVPWKHIWYWYAFFAPNVPLAFGKIPAAGMGPLWSLGVEEQFYFLWPFLLLVSTKEALRHILLAIIVISPVLRAICTPLFDTHFPIFSLTIFRADTLAVGALIAVTASRSPNWINENSRKALAILIGAAALLAGFSTMHSFRAGANSIFFNSVGYSLSAILFGGALVYSLGYQSGMLHALLTLAPLRYLGLISYTFYLYHEVVLLRIGQALHSQAAVGLAAFVVTLIISTMSWHFFESPILGQKRRSVSGVPSRALRGGWEAKSVESSEPGRQEI